MEVRKLWSEVLKKSAGPENGHVLRKISSNGAYVGTEVISGLRVFVIEFPDEKISEILRDFPKWRGIEIYSLSLSSSAIGLCLKLLKNVNSHVFESLVEDVLTEIDKANSKEEFETIVITRIQRWFDFFKMSGGTNLGRHEQIGLFGELYFLMYVLIPEIGLEKSLKAWVGPRGKHQDFNFINGNLELKTSLSKEHRKIHISSENQLNWKSLKNLFLGILIITESDSEGLTLKQLVFKCRSEFSNNQLLLDPFNSNLERLGYHDVHHEFYDKERWKVNSVEAYLVGEGFPCITNLPEGVGDLKYSIMISACSKYKTPLMECLKTLTDYGYN